ncbi:MAG: sigma-70 family RNA polymerase sigma factor, partial [Bacteroidales bacterium]|nr:sigma-70 family RNA polymerase sigma factor [Bacteroidales bacterium]
MEVAYQDIHREIVELSKAGSRKAQHQLYKLYSKAMFNICYRMLNSIEEAEDLLQEAFAEAFNKLESFRFESSFGAWLKRIVVNRCINHLKKRRAELVYTETIPEDKNNSDDADITTEDMLNVKKIKQAINKLPEGYRVIFSLYLIEGYDHAEIAQIMGITESTSKSQFSRA